MTPLGKDTFSAIIDLADLKWTQKANLYYYTAQKDFEIFPNLKDAEYQSPHIKLVFTSPKDLSRPADDPVMNRKDEEIKGIPYRSGGALLVETIFTYTHTDEKLVKHIIDNYLILPQLGPVGIIAFKSKPFSDSKQILTFSANSNILISYKIENTSSGERLSSELASITSKINAELDTLKTSNPELFMTLEELSQKEELDELAYQLKLYKAILAVETEKDKIEKLKPESEEP